MVRIIFHVFMGRVSQGFTSSSSFFSAIIEQAKHASVSENYSRKKMQRAGKAHWISL